MLSFAEKSNMIGFDLNTLLRVIMFMKIRKHPVFLHAFVFQATNLTLFMALILLYFLLNEKDIATVYNIYKWVSLGLFVIIMAITAVDAIILEKNGKGKKDESN